MRLNVPSLLVAVACALAAPLAAQDTDPWVGTFRGDGLELTLRAGTAGEYRGNATEDGVRFSLTGKVTGATLEGTYSFLLVRQRFSAELEGDRMVVKVPDDTYTLFRAGSDAERAALAAESAVGDAANTSPAGVVAAAPAPAATTSGALVDQWRERLAGQRLVRLSRSGSGGSGSQSRTTVTICRDGRTGYHYTYSMAADVGGVFGNSSERDEAEGRWEVIARGAQPLLIQRFTDGRVFEWVLTMESDRIHLDGRQYLRDTSPC